jgi:hypothetical protein
MGEDADFGIDWSPDMVGHVGALAAVGLTGAQYGGLPAAAVLTGWTAAGYAIGYAVKAFFNKVFS